MSKFKIGDIVLNGATTGEWEILEIVEGTQDDLGFQRYSVNVLESNWAEKGYKFSWVLYRRTKLHPAYNLKKEFDNEI